MKKLFFLLQIILLIFQLCVYFLSSNGDVSFLIVNFSAITVLMSFLFSWRFRNQTFMKGYGFSIILFFVLMNWIVSFQVPLEIVYGNSDLLNQNLRLIYDRTAINKIVSFSSLMLNFFLVGVTYSYSERRVFYNRNNSNFHDYKINSTPLFFLLILLFFSFLLTVNSDYVDHGHGSASLDSFSASVIGIFARLSAIYLAIKIFNYRKKNMSLIGFLHGLNFYYLVLIAFTVIVFFIAHNRFYPLMILTPILFSFFIFSYKKVGIIKVVSIFLMLSVFATLFKLYGISDIYSSGFYINDDYLISKFYFPFTAELSGSIYSSSVLYALWDNLDTSLYGASYFAGVLRAFPGVMGFLSMYFPDHNTAVLATAYTGSDYGLGTTAIFDLLINFGVFLSLLIFLVLGYFFGRAEMNVYALGASPYSYVIYLTITILLFFYPRGSMNDMISMLIFNMIFFKIYILIFKKQD